MLVGSLCWVYWFIKLHPTNYAFVQSSEPAVSIHSLSNVYRCIASKENIESILCAARKSQVSALSLRHRPCRPHAWRWGCSQFPRVPRWSLSFWWVFPTSPWILRRGTNPWPPGRPWRRQTWHRSSWPHTINPGNPPGLDHTYLHLKKPVHPPFIITVYAINALQIETWWDFNVNRITKSLIRTMYMHPCILFCIEMCWENIHWHFDVSI